MGLVKRFKIIKREHKYRIQYRLKFWPFWFTYKRLASPEGIYLPAEFKSIESCEREIKEYQSQLGPWSTIKRIENK